MSRDVTYDLMVDIWRLARPDLAPPKVPKGAQNVEAESSDDESDSYYDSDTEDSYSDDTEANVSNTKEPGREYTLILRLNLMRYPFRR